MNGIYVNVVVGIHSEYYGYKEFEAGEYISIKLKSDEIIEGTIGKIDAAGTIEMMDDEGVEIVVKFDDIETWI